MQVGSALWLPHDVWGLVDALADALRARGWRMASAESCTGGLVAAACTTRAGSSDWFERGWVTYANAAKVEELGVPVALLEAHGAVSEPVARAMAAGAAQRAGVPAALAITGVAGPTGGSAAKPVGTVWLGWSVAGTVSAHGHRLDGDRAAVRGQAVVAALQGLLQRLRAVA